MLTYNHQLYWQIIIKPTVTLANRYHHNHSQITT